MSNFYFGKNGTVLFKGWPNDDLAMYILALVFVFWISVAAEFLTLPPVIKPTTRPVIGGLTLASVYGLKTVFAYLVMLSVMSFNVGVLVLAVSGHAFGLLLVRRKMVAAPPEPAATSAVLPPVGIPQHG